MSGGETHCMFCKKKLTDNPPPIELRNYWWGYECDRCGGTFYAHAVTGFRKPNRRPSPMEILVAAVK
ncbi:MAG: hypothetical protein ACTSYX_01280 [Candidatus Thorarchaeota archaeon]